MNLTHKIKNDSGAELYGVACDPLDDIFVDVGQINVGQNCRAGTLPVLVTGVSKKVVFDQLFTEYTLDENGNLDTYMARETTVSVDYSESDAVETSLTVQEITDGVMVRPIKHPTKNEWAMHVSAHIITSAREGAKKDALMAKHLGKIEAGKNKTKSQAKREGWK